MILVFGANGQLGQELQHLAARAAIPLVGATRSDVDINDAGGVNAALERINPKLIVNVGAYTAVDKAENDVAAAMRANAEAPAILGKAAQARDIPIIHFSTDYVFNGEQSGSYSESDPLAPLGVYGASKAAGEAALAAAAEKHIILRTAWVYGVYGANFLKTMIRLARERDELRVVADQIGSPSSTYSLASAVLAIAPRVIAEGKKPRSDLWGIYHLTGSGQTSWHGFASAIVEDAAPFLGRKPIVTPITTADYPTPARRPANSVLNNGKFERVFHHRTPDWRTDAQRAVHALLSQET